MSGATVAQAEIKDSLGPPTPADVEAALIDFANAVRRHYGDRLRGLYLFGSRARGDHGPYSDADVAVILSGFERDLWGEKMQLADIAYDVVVATGVDAQGWPVLVEDWEKPDRHRNPALIRAMRRDAKELQGSA